MALIANMYFHNSLVPWKQTEYPQDYVSISLMWRRVWWDQEANFKSNYRLLTYWEDNIP